MKPAQSRDNWLPWAYFPILTANGIQEALDAQFESYCVENRKTIYRAHWGNETLGAERVELIEKIDALWKKHNGIRVEESGPNFSCWAGPEGVMMYSAMTMEMITFDQTFLHDMRLAFEKLEPAEGAPPAVHILEGSPEGYRFNEMKVPPSPFIRSNYNEKVAAQYDVVLDGITSFDPAGRLTLLTGEPGTGKSHFVRALLEDARGDAIFCLVPPHLLTALDGPNLVGSLRELREPDAGPRRRRRRHATYEPEENVNKTVVLILEDADAMLVQRGLDNMSAIAALLNMSDGIFGAALDLRIIATTNAKSFEIDPALERAGRLLTHVMFDKLKVEEANEVLRRLGADQRILQSTTKPVYTTLADVYAMARKEKR